jgi:hypothetical protein
VERRYYRGMGVQVTGAEPGRILLLRLLLAAGARLSPAAALSQGDASRNTRAALRCRCCCGWGQPRSGGSARMPPGQNYSCEGS